jgi:hypothetical protein
MPDAGWKQQHQEGFFIKDRYMAVIACSSSKDKAGKTEFSVTNSNIPVKEEFLAMRKVKPDKLDYMPVYPGSEQLFLLNLPFGMSSAYETGGSVKEVVFFYETGMLNYGWSFDYDESDKGKNTKVNYSLKQKLIPGFPSNADEPGIINSDNKVILVFRRKNVEICVIRISGASPDLDSLLLGDKSGAKKNAGSPGKTTIFANYHARANIQP